MERQNPLTSRGASAIAMAVEGHEDPFPPRWLNVRCVIRHGTFAETNGNGRDAPEADRGGSTPRGRLLGKRHPEP
jgi:hypothetical protein